MVLDLPLSMGHKDTGVESEPNPLTKCIRQKLEKSLSQTHYLKVIRAWRSIKSRFAENNREQLFSCELMRVLMRNIER